MVAGYGPYLDLLPRELLRGKECLSSGMTREIERCRAAVDAARNGRRSVIVSSGDAGVYGMAGLALEILETEGLSGHIDFEVVPGVPALAAAAALLGAPLVGDFACISLSDLLTPIEVITERLRHASAADFVLVLYNPRSRRRTEPFRTAMEILLQQRGEACPAGHVRNAFREGQMIWSGVLGSLREEDVDMVSLVIVGNTSTRVTSTGLLTSRGYQRKYGELLERPSFPPDPA